VTAPDEATVNVPQASSPQRVQFNGIVGSFDDTLYTWGAGNGQVGIKQNGTFEATLNFDASDAFVANVTSVAVSIEDGTNIQTNTVPVNGPGTYSVSVQSAVTTQTALAFVVLIGTAGTTAGTTARLSDDSTFTVTKL
jgi:hypothetical protein